MAGFSRANPRNLNSRGLPPKYVLYAAGSSVVIEEFLVGEEMSFFALTDGEHALPLVGAQDHKRVFDGDKGPNTGGMGAYSPAPVLPPAMEQVAIDRFIKPTVAAMKPFYMIRLLGGVFFLSGALIIVYNVWRTVRGQSEAAATLRPAIAA